jgi:hypothetical protein
VQVVPTNDILMEDVTGVDAFALQPTGGGDLVEQLNAAARRPLLWPWAAGSVLVAAAVASGSPVASVVILILGSLGVGWLGIWERAKRTVLAFYDVTGPDGSVVRQPCQRLSDFGRAGRRLAS